MNLPQPIREALALPGGARFRRCALQVNPFAYVQRHDKATIFATEADYNAAIVDGCRQRNIEAIAITDHQRCDTGRSLAEAARAAGIVVFPGAEVETKEGVHFLLLFDPESSWKRCTGVLGDCGIHDQADPPTNIKYDVLELLKESKRWDCVCIAAHMASEKGLLRILDNQARVAAWQSPYLFAGSLPGPKEDAPENLRPILQNRNHDYRRDRPIAVVNANDISAPEDLDKPGTSCWIKMSHVSVEGLRQAFLDHESRIRLASDPEPEPHIEFLAMAWEGGFLDGAALRFNENLNVLIGGRGTGKSTIIESLRYVLGLDPLGEDIQKAHQGIIRHVLKSGTKVYLLLRSPHPSPRDYLIERTVPNPPVVRDADGNLLNISPEDIVAQVEVFGQHEISELTRRPEKLTRLLDRFVPKDPGLAGRRAELQRQLERSRQRILDARKELSQIEERLAALPSLEETLKRFQEAGMEEKLKVQSLVVREEHVLKTAEVRLEPFADCLSQLRRELPIDTAFLAPKALDDLPGKDIIGGAETVLSAFSREMEAVLQETEKLIQKAGTSLVTVRQQWEKRRQTLQAEYERILRDLQKSRVDGEEFIRLRRQIEALRPMRERGQNIRRDLGVFEEERRKLVTEWEDAKAEAFRLLERAARKVSRQLRGRVRVEVIAAGNREPLAVLLRERIGGRLSECIDAIQSTSDLSLPAFVQSCRLGKDALSKDYACPPSQASRVAEAGEGILMEIEALDLPPTTIIKLNVAAEGEEADWQALDNLSTGQKATAVLLLLLLESDAPLVVDQPEDDLDNRFITEGVVPKMRWEKRRRQFVFATHNANVPVLGDAEQIIGLSARGEAGEGRAKLSRDFMGSIDSATVREMVEEVLEGGKAAFEMRRLKYGF